MSNSTAKVYTDTVRKSQRVLYGVWEPGSPVELGDYGVMEGNIFVHQGNLKEFDELKDFKITIRKDKTEDDKTFSSQTGVDFQIKPRVGANLKGIPVNASIDFTFSKENAVFFNAAGCVVEMIENKYQLGEKLLEIHRNDKKRWKKEFVLVTQIVISERALILISTSNDFSISFEADAKVPVIDLANAALELNLKSQKSSGYKLNAKKGLIPLIGLSKMQKKSIFADDEFSPLTTDFIKGSDSAKKPERKVISTELIFDDYTDLK